MFRRNVFESVLPVRTRTKTKPRRSAAAGRLASVCQKHIDKIEPLRHTFGGLITLLQEIWHYKIYAAKWGTNLQVYITFLMLCYIVVIISVRCRDTVRHSVARPCSR